MSLLPFVVWNSRSAESFQGACRVFDGNWIWVNITSMFLALRSAWAIWRTPMMSAAWACSSRVAMSQKTSSRFLPTRSRPLRIPPSALTSMIDGATWAKWSRRAHSGALSRLAAPTVQKGGASLSGGSLSVGLATRTTSLVSLVSFFRTLSLTGSPVAILLLRVSVAVETG